MKNSRSNILFIMADQFRADFLSCAGADFIMTPNIDRIAQRGVRFTHCFTNAPVCAPARIGLATGLQPCRVGALGNSAYLPLSATTYYQRLRDSGYRVGCVGKLDLAKPSEYNGRRGDRPCVFGFGFTHPEECEGKMHAGRTGKPMGPYGHYLQQRGVFEQFSQDYIRRKQQGWTTGACEDSVLATEDFEDSYIGRRAVEWLNKVSDEFPWHLFVSFVGPHDPYDPPSEYADRYRDAATPEPIADDLASKPQWIKNKCKAPSAEAVRVTRRQYCAAITLIDEQIGRIMDALETRGELDNTYIVFASDHGDMLGDHGLYQKSVAYESAVRVPLIVAGPGICPGKTTSALTELIDINPTVCELAGLDKQVNIDARTATAVLFDADCHEHRESVVTRMPNFQCIRTDRYKYIHNVNDTEELYDLAADPTELNNLAGEEKDLAQALKKALNHRYLEGEWQR